MVQKFSELKLSNEAKKELSEFADRIREKTHLDAAYMVVPHEELPQAIPRELRDKCPTETVVMTSDVTEDMSVMAINLRRWDPADLAVDQEPLAVAFFQGKVCYRAGIVHHGDWPERTQQAVDSDFEKSYHVPTPISDVLLVSSLPEKEMGPLSDLEGHSDRDASRAAWDYLYAIPDDE